MFDAFNEVNARPLPATAPAVVKLPPDTLPVAVIVVVADIKPVTASPLLDAIAIVVPPTLAIMLAPELGMLIDVEPNVIALACMLPI
jgi:hypothetical protein